MARNPLAVARDPIGVWLGRGTATVLYLKSPNCARDLEPLASWGTFTRYIEIGDDLHAVRHVDVYANGNSLRYDRFHWADELGMLADIRYDGKQWSKWWGTIVESSPNEFEEVWLVGERSPTRPMQLAGEKMSVMGAVPIWLAKLEKNKG